MSVQALGRLTVLALLTALACGSWPRTAGQFRHLHGHMRREELTLQRMRLQILYAVMQSEVYAELGHAASEEAIGAIITAGYPELSHTPDDLFFEQATNHFDTADDRTFQQRYWATDRFWSRPDGPVLLLVGGEMAGNPLDLVYGHYLELAQELGALVFAIEHRYYGLSVPTQDLSDPNLEWLTVDQAMADMAHFKHFASRSYGLTSKNVWFTVGGSYAGALAAWARLNFPREFHGSIAYSPLFWGEPFVSSFNSRVEAALSEPESHGSPACLTKVRHGFGEVGRLLRTQRGRKRLDSIFNPCTKFSRMTPSDHVSFLQNIAGIVQGAAQYNKQLRFGLNVSSVCEVMLKTTDPVQGLAQLVLPDPAGCSTFEYEEGLRKLHPIEVPRKGLYYGDRQWMWQACTQLGSFPVCGRAPKSSGECLFASPDMNATAYYRICRDVFGISSADVQIAVARCRERFVLAAGSLEEERVLVVSGGSDPWAGLAEHLSGPNHIVIPGASHCAAMQSSAPFDEAPLAEGRVKIGEAVRQWVASANPDYQLPTAVPRDPLPIESVTEPTIRLMADEIEAELVEHAGEVGGLESLKFTGPDDDIDHLPAYASPRSLSPTDTRPVLNADLRADSLQEAMAQDLGLPIQRLHKLHPDHTNGPLGSRSEG